MNNITHSPFLYHLFVCCGGNYKDFVSDISNQTQNKIEELYRTVYDNLTNKKIDESSWSALTNQFRDFVKQVEQCKKGRTPKYCMFEFYKQIAKLEQYLTSPTNNRDVVLQSDIDTIQRFRSAYDYFCENEAVAINDKRLRDLLRKIRESKALNKTQEDLFDFLLNESFPNYGDERGGLLERLRSKPWEEVAFGNLSQQKIIIDTLQKDDRYEQIKMLFDNFNHIVSGEVDDIKKNLVKISNYLDKIYQLENNFDSTADKDKVTNISIEDGLEREGKDSELHSHILAFMRWIPMISQDKPDEKMMESVDNVIDQIKVQVYEIIADNDSLKCSLKTYPTGYHDIIFTHAEGTNLRKLLINAMCHEPNIYLQFGHFYGVDVSKTGVKGGIQ